MDKTYDIKQRTFEFAVSVVNFINGLPKTTAGSTLGKQLIRSGTSIGANIEEADGSISKKDFIHKVSISRKEARETKYWLKIIISSIPCDKQTALKLLKESEELTKILSAIIQNSQKK